jgi:periplasmic protein CpxP/Spy
MRKEFKLIVAATSLLALTALGTHAVAGPGPRCDHDGGPGWSEMQGDFKARAEKRLGDLKAGLKLRPEQEGSWKTFSGVLLAQAEEMQGKVKAWRTTSEAKTALERIEQVQKGAEERRAALDAVAGATKTFYGALDGEQKAYFDQNFRLMPGERGRHHRRPA